MAHWFFLREAELDFTYCASKLKPSSGLEGGNFTTQIPTAGGNWLHLSFVGRCTCEQAGLEGCSVHLTLVIVKESPGEELC